MQRRKRRRYIGIIEDDPALRDATRELLHSFGFSTRVFSSAEQFLRSTSARSLECLILDVQLPGMDGIELLRKLRSAEWAIPTIVITGSTRHGRLKAEALRAGAVDVLRKPFDADELLRLIRAALARD